MLPALLCGKQRRFNQPEGERGGRGPSGSFPTFNRIGTAQPYPGRAGSSNAPGFAVRWNLCGFHRIHMAFCCAVVQNVV